MEDVKLNLKLEHLAVFPCANCDFLGKQVESSKHCVNCKTNLCDNCIINHASSHKLVSMDTSQRSASRLSNATTDSRQNSVVSRNSVIPTRQSSRAEIPRSHSLGTLSSRQNSTISSARTTATPRRSSLQSCRSSSITLISRRNSVTTSRRSSVRGLEECLLHGLPVEVYCSSHGTLCCEECVSTVHTHCDHVIPINAAAEGIRGSSDYLDLDDEIKSRKTHCQQLKQQREGGLENIALQDEKFVKAVQDFRKTINATLDELEAALVNQKKALIESETMEVHSQVKTCDTAIGVLDTASRQLEAAEKADDEQLFIAVKSITTSLHKCDSVLEGMDTEEDNISFDFTPHYQLEMIESIGELNIHSSYLHSDEAMQRRWILKPMGEIHVKMPNDTGICNITGSAYLDNGKLVVADESNQCLRIIGQDHKPRARVALSSFPWDVCAMSNTQVAVTLPKLESVQVVTVEGKVRIERNLQLKHACRGIAHYNGYLYLTCSAQNTPHLKIIDDEGTPIRKIQPKKGILYDPHYVNIDSGGEVLYVSDWKKGVVAIDQKGYLLFTCHDSRAVCYWDVTFDKFGQVYIITKDPNAICRAGDDKRKLVPIQIWPEQRSVTYLTMAYNPTSDTIVVSVDGPDGDTLKIFKIS